MSNYSFSELTRRLTGKSVTLQWDAVVFLNRAKVNTLLEQQYIRRIKKDSFMKRISGALAMTPDGGEYLEVNGLVLGEPKISFEEASLLDSKAKATMEIRSGTVSYVRKGTLQVPALILYTYEISAHQGFTVTLDIKLEQSKGTVNEQGEVVVDFAGGDNWRCNLVNNANSQKMLGDFFKAQYAQQKPEDRVYTLGKLNLRDVDLLAPRSFITRTMATDEGKIRTSDNYGDGAVVMFIRCKGNPKEGAYPGEGAIDYLIPNDRDPQGKAIYSGAMVLSSRVMFDWYFQYQITNKIGHNLRLERSSESDYIARKLTAIAGEIELGSFYYKYWEYVFEYFELYTVGPASYKLFNDPGENGLTISAKDGVLSARCKGAQPMRCRVYRSYWGSEEYREVDIYINSDIEFIFDPVVEPFNKIVFKARADVEPSVSFDYSGIEAAPDIVDYVQSRFKEVYDAEAAKVVKLFKDSAINDNFDIPDLNVMAISNVLFPEENALQLTEARLTGDLYTCGHIDPKETTFTLEPLMPVIKAGQQQQFTIRQLGYRAANVTWSVRSVDGARAAGSIDNQGLYTAADAQLLEGNAVRNVVTATYQDPVTREEVTASALTTVVLAGVVVTPALVQINMRDDNAETVTLKATTLGAGPLKWTLRGNQGSLSTNQGGEVIYTRPQTPPAGSLETVLIDVEDELTHEKAIASVLLLNGTFSLVVTPALHSGLRPGSRALLQGPEGVSLEWSVVAGEGQVDRDTGEFTAPTVISQPYSIVKGSVAGLVSGYCIIHLSNHAKSSNWFALDVFDFVVEPSTPTKVWANGLQQAKVTVRIKPAEYNGAPDPLELSDTEFDSIRLVSANEHIALPETGEDGVPEGGKWHYNATENGYKQFPDLVAHSPSTTPGQTRAAKMHIKEFFVQCHKVESLLVSARIRSDSGEFFFSNPNKDDGEVNKKAINLVAAPPPDSGEIGQVILTFGDKEPDRVEGYEDDFTLENTYYYFLKLLIRGVQVPIKNIQFVGNSSMVKWESDTQLEDVHSITGYALPNDRNSEGQQILHIDEILVRRLGGTAPTPIVNPSWPVPDGQVLFSLHRRQHWRYDKYTKSDFDSALKVLVYDVYGNKHSVNISFEGSNRNRLKINGS